MTALADVSGIHSRLLKRGTLGMAEELASDLAPLIDDFLSANRRQQTERRAAPFVVHDLLKINDGGFVIAVAVWGPLRRP